ncbi:MAG: helix-hairpin-helix domain-containing protein [Fibrobacterota bacterium]|nr:MAG: helix-hairpin-helix domain-containing protein [Fibrobacterota bacterium]
MTTNAELRLNSLSRGEIRLLGLASALFLAGVAWKAAQARLSLPPLETQGVVLEWDAEPVRPSDTTIESSLGAVSVSRTQPKKILGELNPNEATLAQLQGLPGIGPTIAQRIVDERTDGPFQGPDDLLRVKGIGPSRLEKLRPHLKF